jgi:hypothetical protein
MFHAAGRGRGPAVATGGSASHQALMGEPAAFRAPLGHIGGDGRRSGLPGAEPGVSPSTMVDRTGGVRSIWPGVCNAFHGVSFHQPPLIVKLP